MAKNPWIRRGGRGEWGGGGGRKVCREVVKETLKLHPATEIWLMVIQASTRSY